VARILIVDDEDSIRLALKTALSARHQVDEAADGESALVRLAQQGYDLVLTDFKMGAVNGLEVLRQAKAGQPGCAVVLLTAYGSVDHAVEAMKAGADDYLTKPFRLQELELRVEGLLEKARLRDERDALAQALGQGQAQVGQSEPFKAALKLAEQAAKSDASVLILGETGTGKEGLARRVHELSARAKRPFVAVNCAALASGLIESELFGHEKGAFTGAVSARKGRLELADGGTLFLDEVGEIPLETQVKLLRALEQKAFERVGGSATLKSDFRVVAATHRDLQALVREGKFREDLYFRLAVLPITVAPLRERGEDIVLLAQHFLKARGGKALSLDAPAIASLRAYRWPGNVRELMNVIERAALLSDGSRLELEKALPSVASSAAGSETLTLGGLGKLTERLEAAEKAHIIEALERNGQNQSAAAKVLGLERTTLQYKMKKHGLL
jgi:two-component system NtrC family response regulator